MVHVIHVVHVLHVVLTVHVVLVVHVAPGTSCDERDMNDGTSLTSYVLRHPPREKAYHKPRLYILIRGVIVRDPS